MFGHRGVGQEVRHLCISGGFDGGFSDWRTFSQGWTHETSPREVDHHPRGSSFCGVCGFCSGVQPAVVMSWCPPQELQLPAPSSFCSADSSVWRLPCGGSWTKGREPNLVSGPSDKLIGWQAHQWLSPSRKKSRLARRRHPRRRLLGLQCLTGRAPLHPQRRGLSHRSRPFELAPEGPVHNPSKETRSLARLLHLPQPDNVDRSQVGARLTLPCTGGVCWATAGPPASSRMGWALHSSNDLSSPIKASVSGPGVADKTFSKPSMPCWWREP